MRFKELTSGNSPANKVRISYAHQLGNTKRQRFG